MSFPNPVQILQLVVLSVLFLGVGIAFNVWMFNLGVAKDNNYKELIVFMVLGVLPKLMFWQKMNLITWSIFMLLILTIGNHRFNIAKYQKFGSKWWLKNK